MGIACSLFACQALAGGPQEELWNAYGQATFIWHRKAPFPAAYTNLNGSPNSLRPEKERSYTGTATAFLGVRAWTRGELYVVPELISELPLSGLHGLGGSVQDAELEKTGLRNATLYRSRLFLRQTWGGGGETTPVQSAPMQLGGSTQSQRFVLTAGNLAVIDIFDKNAYAGDVRQQFLSMNFLTHAAYDFAADARGYSWGVAGEYFHHEWVFRAGRFLGPRHPNQLQLNYAFLKRYGDQVEIEHKHELYGRPGKIRFLAYRNAVNQGRFDDAMNVFLSDRGKTATACTGFNYGSENAGAPDLCWVRSKNVKTGLGVNIEQNLTGDAGVFFRGMKSDGKSEVYAFTSTDSSISLGGLIRGSGWGRPGDRFGIAYARNWLSRSHVEYLKLGGIDGFIGDGKLNYKAEQALDTFYNFRATRSVWITLDYQRVLAPAYNADRGPVTLVGARLHFEF